LNKRDEEKQKGPVNPEWLFLGISYVASIQLWLEGIEGACVVVVAVVVVVVVVGCRRS